MNTLCPLVGIFQSWEYPNQLQMLLGNVTSLEPVPNPVSFQYVRLQQSNHSKEWFSNASTEWLLQIIGSQGNLQKQNFKATNDYSTTKVNIP